MRKVHAMRFAISLRSKTKNWQLLSLVHHWFTVLIRNFLIILMHPFLSWLRCFSCCAGKHTWWIAVLVHALWLQLINFTLFFQISLLYFVYPALISLGIVLDLNEFHGFLRHALLVWLALICTHKALVAKWISFKYWRTARFNKTFLSCLGCIISSFLLGLRGLVLCRVWMATWFSMHTDFELSVRHMKHLLSCLLTSEVGGVLHGVCLVFRHFCLRSFKLCGVERTLSDKFNCVSIFIATS